MADDLSVAVERLRTSTKRLNAICDTAAQTVRDVEAFLEEINAGTEAWVDYAVVYPDEGQGRYRTEMALAYQRVDSGKYRIAVSKGDYAEDTFEGGVVRAWSECSRDEKLQSFEKMPELLAAIAKSVDERVVKAEKMIADVTARLPLPKKRKGGDK